MDWVVAALTLVQQYLIGKKLWHGWVVMSANNLLWGWVCWRQGLTGLVVLTVIMQVMALRSLVQWRGHGQALP